MNLPDYEYHDSISEYTPYKYENGDGYYYTGVYGRGLGFSYTDWFRDMSGKYLLDNYYNYSLIFQL